MESDSTEVINVTTPDQVEVVRALCLEYGAALVAHAGSDDVLRAQGFAEEVAALPGAYASPRGVLLLALVNGDAAGCVAIRPSGEGAVELKRLFVRPDFRGQSLGRRLVIEAIEAASRLGARRLRLDTLPFMRSAVRLYRSLGFEEIPAYEPNPTPGARFFELTLEPEQPQATLERYAPGDAAHFERLNREWLEEYFRVEDKDRRYFADPEGTILATGGAIFFVREGARTVGTCALIRDPDGRFELAKMAVQYDCRGKGYGQWLVTAALAYAREQGATQVYLLSDEKLADALRLYERMGFVRKPIPGATGYARGDVYMDYAGW